MPSEPSTNFPSLVFFLHVFFPPPEGKVELPEDLRELYALYQQEIHASTYTSGLQTAISGGTPYSSGRDFYDNKLPPICQRSSGG